MMLLRCCLTVIISINSHDISCRYDTMWHAYYTGIYQGKVFTISHTALYFSSKKFKFSRAPRARIYKSEPRESRSLGLAGQLACEELYKFACKDLKNLNSASQCSLIKYVDL
jgi:hypothetical protein